MKLLSTILSLFIALTISSCQKDPKKCDKKCDPQMACTMDFRTIGITIKNADGKPITLDNFKVTRVEDGKVMEQMESFWQEPGAYILFSDGQMKETDKCGKEFTVTGKLGDKEVVNETYTIGHDCCHIELLKGNRNIIIK